MPRATKPTKRKPEMSKRARYLLKGLQQALDYVEGRPTPGMRITSFYLRQGKWVRRTRTIK